MTAQIHKNLSSQKLHNATVKPLSMNLGQLSSFIGIFSNPVNKKQKKMQPFSILKRYLTYGALSICSLSFHQTSTEAITVNNWSGRWQCNGSEMTIRGNGQRSQIYVYYPQAHGGMPAQEIYTIHHIWLYGAGGIYTYHDSDPAQGPTGVIGVWTGTWRIEAQGNLLRLYRWDHASGWEGKYICKSILN